MKIQLTAAELAKYSKPVRGRGGFESFLRQLQKQIDKDGILEISQPDLEKLLRHSFAYGQGGFQERTKPTARRVR